MFGYVVAYHYAAVACCEGVAYEVYLCIGRVLVFTAAADADRIDLSNSSYLSALGSVVSML